METPGNSGDDALLAAVVKLACQRLERAPWEAIEAELANAWQTLRQPTDPQWEQVSDWVHAACADVEPIRSSNEFDGPE